MSANDKAMRLWGWGLLGGLGVVLFIFWIVSRPIQSATGSPIPRSICLSNLKQLNTSAQIYMADYDEVVMPAGDWHTTLSPYVKNDLIYRCPLIAQDDPNGYGYALEKNVAGKSAARMKHPDQEVLFFESTDLRRSAVERLDTLPLPGRHEGMNAIAYVDGHVKFRKNPEGE